MLNVDMDKDPIETAEDLFAHIFKVAEKGKLIIIISIVLRTLSNIISLSLSLPYGFPSETSSFLKVPVNRGLVITTVIMICVHLGKGISSTGGKIFSSVIISSIHSISLITYLASNTIVNMVMLIHQSDHISDP